MTIDVVGLIEFNRNPKDNSCYNAYARCPYAQDSYDEHANVLL